MRRAFVFASAALCVARPLHALQEPGREKPERIDLAYVSARAQALENLALDRGSSVVAVRSQAATLFERDIQGPRTPIGAPPVWTMPRETVTGKTETAESMNQAAAAAFRRQSAPPPQPLRETVDYAQALVGGNRVAVDDLPRHVMGAYIYSPKEPDKPGRVNLNSLLTDGIVRFIGPRFGWLTLAHEARHALDRERRHELSPDRVIAGEIRAFYAQYLALVVMDPHCERLDVLDSTLRLYLKHHPRSTAAAMAKAYVSSLIELYDTHGERDKLKAFVERVGYEEREPDGETRPLHTPSA